jgi:uncharacterized membrane protein YcgQ (UPF0703/DUF1980 family)
MLVCFEEVGEFSDIWTVVCEGCPFFCFRLYPVFGGLFVSFVHLDLLCNVLESYCLMAWFYIVFHYVCCFSIVSGIDCILLIRNR